MHLCSPLKNIKDVLNNKKSNGYLSFVILRSKKQPVIIQNIQNTQKKIKF